jgi:hypothetical protein
MTAFCSRSRLIADVTALLLALLVTWDGLAFFAKELVLEEIRPFQVNFQRLLGMDRTAADPLGPIIWIQPG